MSLNGLTKIRYEKSFSRIIAADCFWVSEQHTSLVQSMTALLDYCSTARVLIVAGLHTGRGVLSHFFGVARENGLVSDEEGIQEKNVMDGTMRCWDENREEDVIERKKWLIIAKLKWEKAI